MKNIALLALFGLALTGCGKPPATKPENSYTRWHSIQAQIVDRQGQILELQESLEKLNSEEEANCRAMKPPKVWAILNNVGPTCYPANQLQQSQPPPAPEKTK